MNQEMNDQHQEEWAGPGRNMNIPDDEIGVLPVCLDCLDSEEKKYPDARPDGGAVEFEDETLEERVDATRQQAEGSGEEERGDDGSVFDFEALEKRNEGDGV